MGFKEEEFFFWIVNCINPTPVCRQNVAEMKYDILENYNDSNYVYAY
jgi:hypothetical protein